MTEVIRSKLHLEAIDRLAVGNRHYTCVVDEYVERLELLREFIRKATHRGQISQIKLNKMTLA